MLKKSFRRCVQELDTFDDSKWKHISVHEIFIIYFIFFFTMVQPLSFVSNLDVASKSHLWIPVVAVLGETSGTFYLLQDGFMCTHCQYCMCCGHYLRHGAIWFERRLDILYYLLARVWIVPPMRQGEPSQSQQGERNSRRYVTDNQTTEPSGCFHRDSRVPQVSVGFLSKTRIS